MAQTLLVVTGSAAIAVLTLLALQTYLSEYSIGFAHITINQRNVRGSIKANGRGSSAGGAFGSIKGDHDIAVNQEDVEFDVEAGPESCAGGAFGSIGNCGTGIKTGNSHGNDYSGGDGDDNGASFRVFPHMNDKPLMKQLFLLEPKDGGNPVRISERIGAQNIKLGTYLLNDNDGTIVHAIKNDARGIIEAMNEEIFRRWLNGSGVQPVSWKVLVDGLRDIAQLKELADDIVDALNTVHG